MRKATITRKTNETSVEVEINIDGTGQYNIASGIGFLDHMLEQLSKHSLMDITVKAEGDLHIDMHHTTEDIAIALGQAFRKAMGEMRGIKRFAHAYLPMDEALTRVSVDISGRPFLVWDVEFSRPKVGEMDTELFQEWFQGFAQNAAITLHVQNLYGDNNHHIVESSFKALAQSLRQAATIDPRLGDEIPSTKGSLGD